MPEKYSPDRIEHALATIEIYRGDVKKAAHYLDIPAKLLKRWILIAQREMAAQARGPLLPITRPNPPEALLDDFEEVGKILFVPAPELNTWLRDTIICGGQLFNPDHDHLQEAHVGYLWTNVPNVRQGRRIVGTAEIPRAQGNIWAKSRAEHQLVEWFGQLPDFLITLDAPYAYEADDASYCALMEHELYHCAPKLDMWGEPSIDEEGRLRYTMKGHCVEEHIPIVERYGSGPAASGVAKMVAAAMKPPTVARASISIACGTCLK